MKQIKKQYQLFIGKTTGRLLAMAALFLILFASALTLSESARNRTFDTDLRWGHWAAVVVWLVVFYVLYTQTQKQTPQTDPLVLPFTGLLTGWGLLTIWRLTTYFGIRQTIWLVVAGGIYFAGLRLSSDLSILRRYKYIWLTSGLLLTTLTLIFGTNPMGTGPRLWLGCCGVYFQPSEPLKLLLIIYLAAYLADRQPLTTNLVTLVAPTFVIAGMALLLLVVQRDLGTASIFMFIYTGVIFAATGKRRTLLLILVTMAVISFVGYTLFDVVRIRVDAWINPWLDPSGRSYQIIQSMIAIASGGIGGRGPGLGYPNLVPISHSDFIFSSIAEDNGLVGSIGLLILLILLTIRGFRIAIQASNRYHRYLAAGITIYIASQSIMIIGGNVRLLPLTGVTLPFVSYGGSSLVTSFLALLFLNHISNHAAENQPVKLSPAPLSFLAGILVTGFVTAALVNSWWAVWRGPDLLTRTDNARRTISDRFVQRGAILDRNDEPLSITVTTSGEYERVYLYPPLSPVIGYTQPFYGQAGAEASLDPILRGDEGNDPWVVWFNHLIYGQPPAGLDVRTSISLELQTKADQLLEGKSGAVVLLNAETGEILVMASSPTFDANTLEETWTSLYQSTNAPLVNRSTLGAYPPGAVLGPFLLAATEKRGEMPADINSLDYSIGDQVLTCSIGAPRNTTWEESVAAGCPGSAAALGLELGGKELLTLFNSLGFFSPPDIRLPAKSQSPPTSITKPGLEAVGYGDLRVSPLQIALAASVFSNGGVIPAPRFVLAVEDPEGGWVEVSPSTTPQQIFPANTASRVANALSSGIFWHITALTSAPNLETLTWFVGGTQPGAETPLTVVVLLEEEDLEYGEVVGVILLEIASLNH